MDLPSSSSNATCFQYDQRHTQPGTSRKKPSHPHHQHKMKPIHHQSKKKHAEEQQPSFQPITTTTAPTDPDLSADTHRYFAEARSTPIMYSTSSLHSTTSTSSSSSLEYSPTGAKEHTKRHGKADDNRSLCSAHSFTAAQQQQMEYLNNRTGSSITTTTTHSSTRNQTFYFGTPLPPQKQQPYQYHDPTWYYGDESNTPPWHTPGTLSQSQQQPSASGSKSSFLARKKDMFLQSNANHRRRLSEGGASIKSAFSTGRQTIKSWRQKRINIMMKQHQLPDFETKAFCEVCEKYIQTRIRYRNGSMVWLMSFIL